MPANCDLIAASAADGLCCNKCGKPLGWDFCESSTYMEAFCCSTLYSLVPVISRLVIKEPRKRKESECLTSRTKSA